MKVFRGRGQFDDYLVALRSVEGGTISPGGAAIMLGYTRQRIWQLVKSGELRAWVFYEERSTAAIYAEIAVEDVIRYGIKMGRIKSAEDLIYASKKQFDKVKSEMLT
jgi:hypothetical protein